MGLLKKSNKSKINIPQMLSDMINWQKNLLTFDNYWSLAIQNGDKKSINGVVDTLNRHKEAFWKYTGDIENAIKDPILGGAISDLRQLKARLESVAQEYENGLKSFKTQRSICPISVNKLNIDAGVIIRLLREIDRIIKQGY